MPIVWQSVIHWAATSAYVLLTNLVGLRFAPARSNLIAVRSPTGAREPLMAQSDRDPGPFQMSPSLSKRRGRAWRDHRDKTHRAASSPLLQLPRVRHGDAMV